jgi:hypothetical protein
MRRDEVLARSRLWPDRSVEYDQQAIWRDGYRQDCSGYVSMCWKIPPAENDGWGGQSTVTLVSLGYMREISVNDLLPGDAIGICGPETAGDFGHIVLFRGWLNSDPNDDRYYCSEQMGGTYGPVHSVRNYPYDGYGGNWRAWRYRGIDSIGVDDVLTKQDLKDITQNVTNALGRGTWRDGYMESTFDGPYRPTAKAPIPTLAGIAGQVSGIASRVERLQSPSVSDAQVAQLAAALAPAMEAAAEAAVRKVLGEVDGK